MIEAIIYLAGGCFWGMEKYFESINGVNSVEVGYANGATANPSYLDVINGSDHAEVVKVTYDPEIAPLSFLLDMYFDVIDPTSLNHQGNDFGRQYRTGIYYVNDADLPIIQSSIAKLQSEYNDPILIEVKRLENYYTAEQYHQNYLDKNPSGYCHIGPDAFERARHAKGQDIKQKNDEQLLQQLTPLQYQVTQNNATEPAFDNEYYNNNEDGIYVDIVTKEPLFSSRDKYDSGCGWPSFTKPIDTTKVIQKPDLSYGMSRTEVRSKSGNSHLGHLFDDGPSEHGSQRYCINSASLKFIPKKDLIKEGYGDYLYLFPDE